MDLDPVGADLSGENQLTLNPASGLDPSRQVKYVPTAATAVYPNVAAPVYASVESTENVEPKTPRALQVVPVIGQNVATGPVQLEAPNPVNLTPRATEFSAQSREPQPGGPGGPAPYSRVAQPPANPYHPQAYPPGTNEGVFGGNRQVVPEYDAQRNNLETAKRNLQGQVDRLEGDARNPFKQWWFGSDEISKATDEATEKRLKIQQIEQALQAQRDIQLTAKNAGVSVGPFATPETIIQSLVTDYKSGDPVKSKKAEESLIAANRPDLVKGYHEQAVDAMESTIKAQKKIREELDTATTDKQYDEKRAQLQKRADAVGFTIPKSLGEWESPKQRSVRVNAERRALLMLDQHRTQVAEQNDYTPEMNKDNAAIYASKATLPNGPMPDVVGVKHGNGSTGGQAKTGSHILTDYGREWNNYGPAQQTEVGKLITATFPEGEQAKYLSFYSAISLATTNPKTGEPLDGPAYKKLINTNPTVQAPIDEALAQAFRGGGGANGQLVRLGLAHRGFVQRGFDELITAYAGGKNVITGASTPYLSKMTQEQLRYVLDFVKDYTTKDIQTRLAKPANVAGGYGAKAEELPLQKEFQEALRPQVDRGRDLAIQHMGRQYRNIGSDYSIFLGTNPAAAAVPGAVRTPVPATALPALYPELQAPPPPPPAATSVAPIPGGGSAPSGTTTPPPGGAVPSFGAGAAPVPYAPTAPAAPPVRVIPGPTGGPALRPLAATPAASLVQSLAPQPAAPAPVQAAQAQLPSSWGVGAPAGAVPSTGGGPGFDQRFGASYRGQQPAAVPPSAPTPQAPGGPGTSTTPPPVAAPQGARPGGTFTQGTPSNGFPAKIADNPVARTVYGVAGQTAQNATQGKNPNSTTIANNSAIVAASSAASESGYRPNETHDGGRGYGLFGHNGDRLRAMHELNGNQPGPIPPNVQAAFYTREMSKYADADPFIARTLANPNASAEDLTRVQVRLEQPKGYKGPGTEEQASGWANRLASTRELMGSAGVQGTAQTTAQPAVAAQPPLAAPSQSLLNPKNALQSIQQAAGRVPAKEALESVPQYAPAIGAVVGGAAAGPPGAIVGGGIGGVVKNYATGEDQTLGGYAKAAGFGAGEGVITAIPGAKPLAMAGRTALSSAIPGFEAYMGDKDAGQIFDAAVWGGLGGAAGETFGKALGAAGNAMWGSYSKATQQQMMAVGKTLAQEEPKVMNAAGKMVDNPVHVAAMARAKQLGQDPDNLKHAWKTAEENVTRNARGEVEASSVRIPPNKGEALTQRPGEVEAMRLQREQLNPMKDEVHAAGGKLPPRPGTFMHDPTNIVGVHPDVPDTQIMRDAAAAAKVQMNQPANSWREIWDNQVKARAKMLQLEREAPGKQQGKAAADGFRAIADEVRAQQEHIVRTLMPPKKADAFMQRLDAVDNAYRKAKVAGGEDIVKVIHAGGPKGREAQAAFNELAKNDDAAKAMMANLLRLHTTAGRVKEGGKYGGLAGAAAAASFVPVAGHSIVAGLGAAASFKALKDYIILRGAGATVKFSDLVRHNMPAAKIGRMQAGANVLGAAAGSTVGEAAGLSEGTRELPRVYIPGTPNMVPPQ